MRMSVVFKSMSLYRISGRLAMLVALYSLSSSTAHAQVLTTNPLDAMKSRVEQVLKEAGQPFTDQQNQELALVMEEQRQASERLFGDIMDFSSGPVPGADRDRAASGIQWMNEAFEAKLLEMLTPEQHRIWTAFRAAETRAQGGLPALRQMLEAASVPLSADQGRRASAIFDRAAQRLRRATEGSSTPRALGTIEDEALGELGDLLTEGQAVAVLSGAALKSDSEDTRAAGAAPQARRQSLVQALRKIARPSATALGLETPGAMPATSEQIAQIRINNNSYTAENFGGRGGFGFGGGPGGGPGGPGGGFPGGGPGGGPGRGGPRGGQRGGGTNIEVIQRGGVGDYHGNFSFDFRDESLTALNAFATNKPPFQQRNINANLSGPFIRNVLSASVTFNQNEQENANTVVATTPTGNVSFGIVSPNVNRSYSSSGQLQIGGGHALHFNTRYSNRNGQNNGIGGFTLPERAWSSTGSDMNVGLREIWAVTSRVLHEVIFNVSGNTNASESVTRGVAIDVLDAFKSGGSGRDNRRTSRNYSLTNMLWYEGERLTFKTGTEFNYRKAESFSQEGFPGLFTFSSLEDFLAGRPVTYSVKRGDPLLDVRQKEAGVFVQTDWRVNRRLTFFAGLRYEWQTSVADYDNVDPRLAFAYSLGSSTVLRGGAGLFHQNLNINTLEEVFRLDGTRQYEVVVSNPTYPNPFAGGDATIVPPTSRRVLGADLAIPYEVRSSLSVERSMRWNIAVDGAFEFNRGRDRYVSRNLNAPRPGETVRPIPTQGNILQLESVARSQSQSLRLGIRQRLSFLNYSANWTLSSDHNDSDFPFYLPMNNYDPRADWGRSGFNSRHRYAFTVNAQTPFGTLVTMSGTGNSGVPYNITTGRDDNGDQTTNDRPANVPRNSGDGPRFFNVDMTLSKTFRPGGRLGGRNAQLSIYANMSNAFNLVNLRNPSGVMTSRYFGIPTSAADARDIELGIRYQF